MAVGEGIRNERRSVDTRSSLVIIRVTAKPLNSHKVSLANGIL